MTGSLRPTAPIAADLILPADPGLAMALAHALLDRPLMANHNHGLWGYSGRSRAGRAGAGGDELTIQSTGIGGPSAALVLSELARHGARRAIRLGRCAALDPALRAGDRLVAESGLAEDGTSRSLGGTRPRPDPALGAGLATAVGDRAASVTVMSVDLLRAPASAGGRGESGGRRIAEAPGEAAVADLETCALLAIGERLGIAVAAALVVAETATGAVDEPATEAALLDLGSACAGALVPAAQASSSGAAGLS